ncbi:polysaccharide deacetylase family protein [Fundidesulfovibrio terrae]|uniref:polysaccharide deacetylase family protein n=1 Tax=Fundidesulfovibrio terrae TaxID=2922866 RepID=UPI001FAFA1D6|nr:polysaccharide deacetylase family protein [Fundidesulfovibrio terrae]
MPTGPDMPLRVVFLVGNDSLSTVDMIRAIRELGGVEIAGIIHDTNRQPLGRRIRNLKRNIGRDGLKYIPFRVLSSILGSLEARERSFVSDADVMDVAKKAFPDRPFSLEDIRDLYSVPLFTVGDMNAPSTASTLSGLRADLGIVCGTRILKDHIFSLPRMGSINIHKGKVPEYRGMPHGFWELYDKREEASVTVHRVESGLDTGDVLSEKTIPIHGNEKLDTLRLKLDEIGILALRDAVQAILDNRPCGAAQSGKGIRPNTSPGLKQRRALADKTGETLDLPGLSVQILKALWSVVAIKGNLPGLLRWIRKKTNAHRGVVFLYHRISPCDDNLSTDMFQFIRHMLALKRHYSPASLEEVVDHIERARRFERDIFSVTFDDCYASVCEYAVPILNHLGIPGGIFVSSGFIDTGRVFEHDSNHPLSFPNMTSTDIERAADAGHSICAHTVNHVNLGETRYEEAYEECLECKKALESITKTSVDIISFPFGGKHHISESSTRAFQSAGIRANFSAYGGTLNSSESLYDIKRLGISGRHSAAGVVLDYEGISLYAFKRNRAARS